MVQLNVDTRSQMSMEDITDQVQQIVRDSGVQNGVCRLYAPHTTAGLTINENADPSVRQDILMELGKIVPLRDNYRHLEGNAAAHIKSSIIGHSETLLVEDGRLTLGTWQGIFLCEFDGPRRRRVLVKVVRDPE